MLKCKMKVNTNIATRNVRTMVQKPKGNLVSMKQKNGVKEDQEHVKYSIEEKQPANEWLFVAPRQSKDSGH